MTFASAQRASTNEDAAHRPWPPGPQSLTVAYRPGQHALMEPTKRLAQVGPYAAHHHYYHIDGLTDLTPTRDQAEKRRKDKKHPECSVIHFHKKDEGCTGKNHEGYTLAAENVTVPS